MIRVKAKVSGVHALTGIGLVAGEEYDIDEKAFGEEIFEKIDVVGEKTGKGRRAAADATAPDADQQGKES
jgi:hypothetical protein